MARRPITSASELLSPRSRKIWLSVLLVVSALACTERQTSLGDGELYDAGSPFSFPRYLISLDSLHIEDGQDRRYVLKGVPSASYNLDLYLLNSNGEFIRGAEKDWGEKAEQLRSAGVAFRVRVGQEVHGDREREYGGKVFSEWQPGANGAFHQSELENVRLSGAVVVDISISMESPVPLESPLLLQPVLVGGGFKI
jgi:hypothetical protein